MAHILYGDLLNTYKRPQEALSAFKKAIELDKKVVLKYGGKCYLLNMK
ncbi:MAG: hypothetical protein IPL33_12275 [Sphingobacteriales bacterium]|nr:hypothetical protein [Sphingobacteriales bacterium]